MSSEPPEQRAADAFKKQVGENWVRYETHIDHELQPFGQMAMQRLALAAGERVLDLGCGSGQTLLELWERVAPNGAVLGVDISEPMLQRAQQRVSEAGLSRVELLLGDAAAAPFSEATFDAAFSRFGVMFFDDPVAGFAHVRRALTARGRLAFVCWQARELNEWVELTLSAVRSVLPELAVPPLMDPNRPGPFFLSDADKVRRTLQQAGFVSVEIDSVAKEMHFGAAQRVEDAVEFALHIGPVARILTDADPALRPAFREALAAAFAPKLSRAGVWLGAAVHVVLAR